MVLIGTRYRNSDASRRIFLQVLTVGILLFNVSSKSAKSASRAGRLHHVTKVGTFFKNVTRLRPMRRLPVEKSGFFTNTWAVELDDPGQDEDAARIANKHGFVVLGKIGSLRNHYHLRHDDVKELHHEHSKEKTELLMLEKEVKTAMQQKYIHREKRDGVPTDPKFGEMWYLLNTGQTGGPVGVDTNVLPVWKSGITGRGVVVAVLDDGLDHTHPDLAPNYEPEASYDFNNHDSDPSPRDEDPDNCHGTRCAGEIVAVANNSICGAGVAYNAKVGGVRMLDGKATDALEASGLSFKRDLIDVYVNCWGPKDDGKTFGKPGPLAAKSLKQGAIEGRKGKGNIYVWATGNGGLTDDDCNCDGYTTSIYTISIGCISDHGLSTYYTELCASTLAVTFNGGAHREREENKMITTDLFHKCTEEFKGTSSAAPIAAGMFSLVLEANPNLTWRDMQHLIVETAQMTSPVDEGWMKNGAGKHFNHKFGFGRMDAAKMVERAKTWPNIPTQKTCIGKVYEEQRDIPSAGSLEFTFESDSCQGTGNKVDKVEHVVLTVSFIHRRRGDLSVLLISPSSTKSELLSTRRYDDSKEGLDDWKFMTVHFWGENPNGQWKVKVTDSPLDDNGQRVVSGYGTIHADTSKQEHDVEDLEQQVIDDQTKQQESLVQQMKTKDPHSDFPYPPGVRRNNLNSTFDSGSLPQYSSNYNGPTSPQSIKRHHIPGSPQDGDSRKRADETKKDSINEKGPAPNTETSFQESKKENIRKVQVATEEKATQRVQVNAGYENPEIVCLGSGCSGIIIRYGLTLYGTRNDGF